MPAVPLPFVYAFDVDHTLWVSGGPIRLPDLVVLRQAGNCLGLCGNFGALTTRLPDWYLLFSFIGPMAMTKSDFLKQIRTYVRASDYIIVGNEGDGVATDQSGVIISKDKLAADEAGWRFISEVAFSLGSR